MTGVGGGQLQVAGAILVGREGNLVFRKLMLTTTMSVLGN